MARAPSKGFATTRNDFKVAFYAGCLNSDVHSFPIFLGSEKLPCFFNFPVSRARPEKLWLWFQLRKSRASQVGLHKQKKAYDKTWTGLITHGLKSRFYGSVHFGFVVVDLLRKCGGKVRNDIFPDTFHTNTLTSPKLKRKFAAETSLGCQTR